MPANYVLLGEVNLAQTATSVTFSNIPQSGYTDLKLVMSVRDARTGIAVSDIRFNFNGTGVGTNISGRYLYGTGSSAASSTITTGELAFGDADGATANTFGNAEVYIPNYLSTTTYKSISSDSVAETNATGGFNLLLAGLWSSNSAINSISMTPFTSPFAANSTFYLYGLAAVGTTPVIAPFASGGDVIQNDGTYWIHTFLSSGTFTPAKNLTCDYLVVAGGAGGGAQHGGGGGAGGLRSTVTATGGGGSLETSLSLLANTAYSAVIGAGGAGTASISLRGSNGSNSTFNTITSTGGGGGGSRLTEQSGATGGSGGGGGYSGAGGSGTANQGYAGGNDLAANAHGGGGGGANQIGSNSNTGGTNGGNGGNGVATSISGTSVTYAGGGGGGANSGTPGSGGSGGGGSGSGNSSTGGAATVNTGGGGGGGGYSGSPGMGGAGGSGIVIIRYPIA